MFYELVSQDTTSVQSQFQNIPVSLFSKSINHLLEEDTIIVPDFRDEKIATYKHSLQHFLDTVNHVSAEYENHNRKHDLNVLKMNVEQTMSGFF